MKCRKNRVMWRMPIQISFSLWKEKVQHHWYLSLNNCGGWWVSSFIVIPETISVRSKKALSAYDVGRLANNYSCPRTLRRFLCVCKQPKQRLNGTWLEMLWMECFSNLRVHLNHLESHKMLWICRYALRIKDIENFLSAYGEFGIREILNSSHLEKSVVLSFILVLMQGIR